MEKRPRFPGEGFSAISGGDLPREGQVEGGRGTEKGKEEVQGPSPRGDRLIVKKIGAYTAEGVLAAREKPQEKRRKINKDGYRGARQNQGGDSIAKPEAQGDVHVSEKIQFPLGGGTKKNRSGGFAIKTFDPLQRPGLPLHRRKTQRGADVKKDDRKDAKILPAQNQEPRKKRETKYSRGTGSTMDQVVRKLVTCLRLGECQKIENGRPKRWRAKSQ